MVTMRFVSLRNTMIIKCYACLTSVKLSHIILLVLLLLIIVPLFVHYYLSKVESNIPQTVHRSHSQLDILDDFNALHASDLKYRIEEMLRIKASVSNELRNLESKSQKLQNEITFFHQQIEQLKAELIRLQTELNKLKVSVQQAQLSHLEALQHNTPGISLPIPLYPKSAPASYPSTINVPQCRRMNGCFDYSRCSLTSGFPVYLYNPETFFTDWNVPLYLKTLIQQTAGYNVHFTVNANIACIFVVLIGESDHFNSSDLKNLPYWGGDGRNHIILNLSVRRADFEIRNVSPSVNTGRAIIAQSSWLANEYRMYHDIVIPPVLGPPGGEIWSDLPSILPARRKYLLSFQGQIFLEQNDVNKQDNIGDSNFNVRFLHQHLTLFTSDEFLLDFNCEISEESHENSLEWLLCKTEKDRSIVLKDSTFVLIPSPLNVSFLSTVSFQTRLFEALKYGAIPLIFGSDQVELPYNEVIDWKKASFLIVVPRITECHWLLRSVPDNDILFMRRQGRLLYEKYFATGQSVLDTVLALVRNRLNIPPPPITDVPSPSIFPSDFKPLQMEPITPDVELEENLGPLEPPFSSPKYQRNFSITHVQGYELWNNWGDPFHLYPQIPFDLLLPSDAKFLGSGTGFRVINGGAGGSGKEYSENLGGNMQKEQFTIVILTYEREQVLMNSLSRLHGLPYLNKVLVVWNSPTPPLQDLRWPDIGVPVHVISVRKNSLNNRFLPFEAIETEAVLSVDDDAHLRHDEIIFGFRVWREQRENIVGFPGRYHALDLNYGGWLYNSNYSCELSMVLTGAAFIHKYYLYLYTYWLPQAIRDMVDEYMNCEDIAMNFLVSHVTRKPPVKVTSRWTFRCPGCPVSLSEDETHFNERHKCINFFAKVFGYTPLLNTQFRADSILFKTRIPHDKQKCFKFI